MLVATAPPSVHQLSLSVLGTAETCVMLCMCMFLGVAPNLFSQRPAAQPVCHPASSAAQCPADCALSIPGQEYYEVLHSCLAVVPAFASDAYYINKVCVLIGL